MIGGQAKSVMMLPSVDCGGKLTVFGDWHFNYCSKIVLVNDF